VSLRQKWLVAAVLAPGVLPRGVYSPRGRYGVDAYYQHGRLLLVELRELRRKHRPAPRLEKRQIGTSSIGHDDQSANRGPRGTRARPATFRRRGALKRGRRLLRWTGKQVIRERIVQVGKKGCAAMAGGVQTVQVKPKTVKGDTGGPLVFNTKGQVVGLRLCRQKSKGKPKLSTVVGFRALRVAAARFFRVRIPVRLGMVDHAGDWVMLQFQKSRRNVRSFLIGDARTYYAGVPAGKKVFFARRASSRRHFNVRGYLQKAGLVILEAAYHHKNRIPRRFIRFRSKARIAAPVRKKHKGRRRKPLRRKRRKKAKQLFLTDGKGYFVVERIRKPPASGRGARSTIAVSTPNGASKALANQTLLLVNGQGRFVGLRIRAAKGKSGVVEQVAVTGPALQRARAALHKKQRRRAKRLFRRVAANIKNLQQQLFSALVWVESTTRPQQRKLGLLFGPHQVLVDWPRSRRNASLRVRAYTDENAPTVAVKQMIYKRDTPNQGLQRIFNASAIARISKPPPHTRPMALKWRPMAATSKRRPRLRWMYVVARRESKLIILPVLQDPGRGLLVATRKENRRQSWHTVGGFPVFQGCAKNCVVHLPAAASALRVYPARESWVPAPPGFKLQVIGGLRYKPARKHWRNIDRRRRRRTRRRRRVRHPIVGRKRRRKKRWKPPKGWYWQIEAATGFGVSTLSEERNDNDEVLAETKQHAVVPIHVVPRVAFYRKRVRGGQIFMGNQFSLEFPFKFQYLAPLDERADHGFRFRMGVGPTTEIALKKNLMLTTGLGLLLPEFGFTVLKERGEKTIGGFYLDLPRVALTYWMSADEGLRFRFATEVGFRFKDDLYGGIQRVRTVFGFHFMLGAVYR
jgi:hypothetical protein